MAPADQQPAGQPIFVCYYQLLQSACPYVCLTVYLSICLSVYLSICLFIGLSVCPVAYLKNHTSKFYQIENCN